MTLKIDSSLGFPVAVIAVSFIDSMEAMFVFFANFYGVLFVIQILTFVLSFNIYEKRGDMR